MDHFSFLLLYGDPPADAPPLDMLPKLVRPWNIAEQTIEDPSTKLRLEFTSVHTEEIEAGHEAPTRDEVVMLKLWTSDRTRLAIFTFDRNGKFSHTTIEPVDMPAAEP